MKREHWGSFLLGRIDGGRQEDFDRELACRNVRVSLWVLPLIILFEAFNVCRVLFLSKSGLSTLNNCRYFGLYMGLLLATLLFFAVAVCARLGKMSPRAVLRGTAVYVLVLILWAAGISAMDSRSVDNGGVFMYVLVTTSVFIYLRPWQSVAIYAAGYLAFAVGLEYICCPGGDRRGLLLNSLVFALIAAVMALVRYHSHAEDYGNRLTISRQNEEIRRVNEQLNRLVVTDTLSGLYNRRFLEALLPERWREEAGRGGPAAVIMMDIDNFKQYNDLYGHQAGDECLRHIADVLKTRLSRKQDYVVRYGGEEFTAVLFSLEREEAFGLAEAIRAAVETEAGGCRHQDACPVTLSLGVCWGSLHPQAELNEYLRQADAALYEAKRQGKNRTVLKEAVRL